MLVHIVLQTHAVTGCVGARVIRIHACVWCTTALEWHCALQVFRLAQLTLEYLLYVQDCLQSTNAWLQNDRCVCVLLVVVATNTRLEYAASRHSCLCASALGWDRAIFISLSTRAYAW